MPSPYYKIRSVHGLNGSPFTSDVLSPLPEPSLSDSINRRVVGSRFQEVNNSSTTVGHIPMGSQVAVNESGRLSPLRPLAESPVPDAAPYGRNVHSSWNTTEFNDGHYNHWYHRSTDPILEESEEDWVDIAHEDPEAIDNGEEYPANERRRPRPPRAWNGIEGHRETFPLRNRPPAAPEEVPPPHLRLQPRQPFVRPMTGMDHDVLGAIYADINTWRSRLKTINAEISAAQSVSYSDIADGARIKGWLLVGKGLRFIPGIQLIEGRAKEDIRWDELQTDGAVLGRMTYWTTVITVSIMLGFGCAF